MREIVLIRHGRPTAAVNPTLDAAGFSGWIRDYHNSLVDRLSKPDPELKSLIADHYVVGSDLPRALDSAERVIGYPLQHIQPLFREMEIPFYPLPVRLSAWHWLYLCRFLWILGVPGPFESYRDAKKRAQRGAQSLISLTESHQKVALFGHGLLNWQMRRYLIRNGWQLIQKSNDYWGVTLLREQL